MNMPTMTGRRDAHESDRKRITRLHYENLALQATVERLTLEKPVSPIMLDSLRKLCAYADLPLSIPEKLSQNEANDLLAFITMALHLGRTA